MNSALIIAAAMSGTASLLHIAIIFGGASWYRFFGAGERFARATERGQVWQHVVTLGIAAVLALWALYGLSGAGVIRPLPLLPWVLLGISAVYLVRGAVLLPLFLFARSKITPFWIWSSLICLSFAIAHIIGLVQVWQRIG
ncbi:MAG: hypothetical protein RL748_3588 [Pseudomonadota bacterium]